jgi:hypothetical protein
MQTHALSYPAGTHPPGATATGRTPFADHVIDLAVGVACVLGPAMAVLDTLVRPLRTAAAAAALARLGVSPRRALRQLWTARAVREAFRLLCAAGFESAVFQRIVLRGNADVLRTPAVLAIYHTPWGRLLGRWIARQGGVILLAAPHWSTRAPGAHAPRSREGMRSLLLELRAGRAAAVTVDHFFEGGRVVRETSVLGVPVTACTGAARLAAAAGVPIVPVSFRWTGRTLEVHLGHRFSVTRDAVRVVTAALIAEFDRAVRVDLSAWGNAHRFLSGRHS